MRASKKELVPRIPCWIIKRLIILRVSNFENYLENGKVH